jgi:hypothetical protein
MSAPKRRPYRPRKAPKVVATPPTRKTELIGLAEDGRMFVWSEGEVQPVSAFETSDGGHWIKSGHYVLNWKGHAITAYCGNMADGNVSVQIMCSGLGSRPMPRFEVEAMLLGKVIPDPEVEARIMEGLKKWGEAVTRANQAPHRQRGRIP